MPRRIDPNDEHPDASLDDDESADATESGSVESRAVVVDAGAHGERLDKVLVAAAGEFSRSHLQGLVRNGSVRVDGEVETGPARRVRAGERIVVRLEPSAESLAYRPEPLPLRVVYEDPHLLVVDKAAGMVVHPAAGHWSGTLLNALLARDASSAALPRAGIVHRLDKDTSGLMVVARSLVAATALTRAIAAREVGRRYLAIAEPRASARIAEPDVREPAERRFSIDAPIGRDPRSRIRMAVVAAGKPARTDVEVVGARDGRLALRCTLHTGRTHQIRVHLASQGMPLVADRLYGGEPALGLERQALHAASLSFAHPSDGRPMSFAAPPPDDFRVAWQLVTKEPAVA